MLLKTLNDLASSGKKVDIFLCDRQTYVENVTVLDVSQGDCKIRCEEISEDGRLETWEWIVRIETISSVGERVAIAPPNSEMLVTTDCPEAERITSAESSVLIRSPFSEPQIFFDSDGREVKIFGISYPDFASLHQDLCPLAYQPNKEPVAIGLGCVGSRSMRLIHSSSASNEILVIFSREGSPIFECCPESELSTVLGDKR